MGAMKPSSPVYQTAQNVILVLRLVGILVVLGSIVYIIQKFRVGIINLLTIYFSPIFEIERFKYMVYYRVI